MKKIVRNQKELSTSKITKNQMLCGDIYLNLYEDILFIRKLCPIEFYKKVVELYGSVSALKEMLLEMDKKGHVFKSNNIRVILDYKEACLFKKQERIQKLKPKFDKINDFYINGIYKPTNSNKTLALSKVYKD